MFKIFNNNYLKFLVFFSIILFKTNFVYSDVKDDVLTALNEAIEFNSMFPEGTNSVTPAEHQKAAIHLTNAIKFGSKLNEKDLINTFGNEFNYEWTLFIQALRYRLDGWNNPNPSKSVKGINGINRFQKYYSKNYEFINSKFQDQSSSSWFSWSPSKGEFLPRVGCNKGAFISWLAGC